MEAEVQKHLQAIIDNPKEGPLHKWLEIKEKLHARGLAYRLVIPVEQLAVHPLNRGGLGCNAWDSHKLGYSIFSSGASLAMLHSSTCVEMSSDMNAKSKEVSFNQKLVELSQGLMSPLSGCERFLTVSSSHTTQFVRSVKARCKTTQSALADSQGCLSLEQWGNDKEFAPWIDEVIFFDGEGGGWWPTIWFCFLCKHSASIQVEMASKGWEWTVVSASACASLPGLVSLMQQALNANNETYSSLTELELMSSLATTAHQLTVAGKSFSWDSLAEQLCHTGPLASYAKVIAKIVSLFGGGQHFPLVHFLHDFQQSFGESLKLGKEYIQAVAQVNLSATNMMPFIRIGLLLANLCSPEQSIVDGYGRLLSRGDVDKLKQKKLAGDLAFCEDILSKAWATSTHASHTIRLQAMGRLAIRCILCLCNKGKAGPEKHDYSLQEAADMFQGDLAAVEQAIVAVEANSCSSSTKKTQVVSLEEGHNPMFVAQMALDLQVGKVYTIKDYPGELFELKKSLWQSLWPIHPCSFFNVWLLAFGSWFFACGNFRIGADNLELEAQDLAKGTSNVVTIAATDVASKVKVSKAKLPRTMDEQELAQCFPNVTAAEELQKSKAFQALYQIYFDNDLDENCIDVIVQDGKPYKLMTKRAFKKNELCLYPMTDKVALLVAPAKAGPKAKVFVQMDGGGKFFINPPKAYKPEAGGSICPFWLMKEQEGGQLVMKEHSSKELKVTYLTNPEPVPKGSVLGLKEEAQGKPSKRQKIGWVAFAIGKKMFNNGWLSWQAFGWVTCHGCLYLCLHYCAMELIVDFVVLDHVEPSCSFCGACHPWWICELGPNIKDS